MNKNQLLELRYCVEEIVGRARTKETIDDELVKRASDVLIDLARDFQTMDCLPKAVFALLIDFAPGIGDCLQYYVGNERIRIGEIYVMINNRVLDCSTMTRDQYNAYVDSLD